MIVEMHRIQRASYSEVCRAIPRGEFVLVRIRPAPVGWFWFWPSCLEVVVTGTDVDIHYKLLYNRLWYVFAYFNVQMVCEVTRYK
jgi:hypothetical protein